MTARRCLMPGQTGDTLRGSEIDPAECEAIYERYWKAMQRCLIVPHDKILEDVIQYQID